ncbi:hypothetical protein M0R45_016510 [Rubus argutus]|uniref:Uncharacterized protein n=1 Tax=Rubus argutus TaxID=59490 RepID=A0AAW1XS49_RUBAR
MSLRTHSAQPWLMAPYGDNDANSAHLHQFQAWVHHVQLIPSTTGFTSTPASPSTAGFTKHRRLHPASPTEPELDPHHTHLPTASPTTPFSPLSEFGNRSKSIAPSPLDSSIAKSS